MSFLPLDLQISSWQTVRLPNGTSTYRHTLERTEIVAAYQRFLLTPTFDRPRHYLLLGPSGSGKTTSLQRLHQSLAQRLDYGLTPSPIPLFIALSEGLPPTQALDQALQRSGHSISSSSLCDLLATGRVCLLLDGLDQCPPHLREQDWRSFRIAHPNVPMLFTSATALTGLDLPSNHRIAPLTDAQRLALLLPTGPDSPESQTLAPHITQALRQLPWTLTNSPLTLTLLRHLLAPHLCQLLPSLPPLPQTLGELLQQLERLDRDCIPPKLLGNYDQSLRFQQSLPRLSDVEIQHQYLNRLDSTDAVAIALSRLTDKTQALRVVRLALDTIDPMLGAKLIAALRPEWQEDAIAQLNAQPLPVPLRYQAWGATQADPVLPWLMAAVEDPNSSLRTSAHAVLGTWTTPRVLAPLQQCLEHRSYFVRASAVQALGQLGRSEVLPALLAARDRETHIYVQDYLQAALTRLDYPASYPNGPTASIFSPPPNSTSLDLQRPGIDIAALLQRLDQGTPDERIQALETLGQLKSAAALPGLFRGLADRHARVFKSAATQLGTSNQPDAIPGLLNALDSPNPGLREAVIKALESLAKAGHRQALPGFLNALQDPQRRIVLAAIQALAIGAYPEACAPLLQCLSTHADSYVRHDAANALGHCGNPTIVPTLLQVLQHLRDYENYERRAILSLLGTWGDASLIPTIEPFCQHPNGDVRQIATRILSHFGQPQSLDDLYRQLQDPEPRSRQAAIAALRTRPPAEAIPGLLQVLRDPLASLQLSAIQALETLKAAEAIPSLIQSLESCDPPVRVAAAQALAILGNPVGLPQLLRALDLDDWPHGDTRAAAAKALRHFTIPAALPLLLNALIYSEPLVRDSLIYVFRQLGPSALAALIHSLTHADASRRHGAAQILGQLQAPDALPALILCLSDRETYVREAAAIALSRLSNPRSLRPLWEAIFQLDVADPPSSLVELGDRLYQAIQIIQADSGVYQVVLS